MCGISGIINYSNLAINTEVFAKLNASLKERGPDHYGYYIDERVGFTHQRLSIIDLSAEANQPFISQDGFVIVTFNGEIYNFKKLKQELSFYHSFRTHSDTEVLVNGYLTWGIDGLLSRLEGMYAFVLYDKRRLKVYAVRDRFGKKPLYYNNTENGFIFSSVINSFVDLGIKLTLNLESLDYYLTELYIPQPNTIYSEIKQIKPSHYITIDLNGFEYLESRYWKLEFDQKLDFSEDQFIDETEKRIIDAVLKRTVSDVPFAAFLSGGVDSGLIVSMLSKYSEQKVNTFSIGFSHEGYNELPQAKLLSKKYNTQHHEFVVKEDLISELPKLVKYMGEPHADPSIIPTYYVCKKVSEQYKVCLSGDGGDEIFGGYHEYADVMMAEQLFCKHLPRWHEIMLSKLSYRVNKKKLNLGHYASVYKDCLNGHILNRKMGFNFQEKGYLYQYKRIHKNDLVHQYQEQIWRDNKSDSITDTFFSSSIQTRLLSGYLVKVDRMSMMNSLEVRSPFLDHSLAEFSMKIPNKIKMKGGRSKYILRKIAEKYLSPNILNQKKIGFGPPIHIWLKKDLYDMTHDLLLAKNAVSKQLFNHRYIEQLLHDHKNEKYNHDHKIWLLLNLELWFQVNNIKNIEL